MIYRKPKTKSTPYQEGYNAYYNGVITSPYKPYHKEDKIWDDGWRAARNDAIAKRRENNQRRK